METIFAIADPWGSREKDLVLDSAKIFGYILAFWCNDAEVDMVSVTKMELEAQLLAVLAQPTRLKILYFLKGTEKCACEITPRMQEDPSVISRHLVKMWEAGLLGYRKQGVSKYYWIREARVFEVLETIDDMLLSSVQERAREVGASL